MYHPPDTIAVLQKLLDTEGPLKALVETGDGSYGSTATLAQWARRVSGRFDSVSMDGVAQYRCHAQLELYNLAPYCTFHTASPTQYLSQIRWLDAAVLHPADLQDGLDQFSLAMSAGARLIIVKGFQHTAARAVQQAIKLNWNAEYTVLYSVLRRP